MDVLNVILLHQKCYIEMRKPYLVLLPKFQDELDRNFGTDWRIGIDIVIAKTLTAEDIQDLLRKD
jgi:hypothetical protein